MDDGGSRAWSLLRTLAMFLCERKKKKKKSCSPGNSNCSKVAKHEASDDGDWEERYRIPPSNSSEKSDYERLIFIPQKQTVDCCSVMKHDGTVEVSVYRPMDPHDVRDCSRYSSLTTPLLSSSKNIYECSRTSRGSDIGSHIEWGNYEPTSLLQSQSPPKQNALSPLGCDGEENPGYRSSLVDKTASGEDKSEQLYFHSEVKRTKLTGNGKDRCRPTTNDPCCRVSATSHENSRNHNSPVRILKTADEVELPKTTSHPTTIASSNTITTNKVPNNRPTASRPSNNLTGAGNTQSATPASSVPTPFTDNLTQLQNCGFYFKSLTSEGAREMLQYETSGTFLLRDSSSQTSYFTLSFVNDKCEVKHLRIEYSCGRFRFHGTESSTVGAKKKTALTVLDLLNLYCNGESGTTLLRRPYTTVVY